MGARGSAYDNAVCEAFFKTLKSELVDQRSWPTKGEARTAVFEFIKCFYNPPTPPLHARLLLTRGVRKNQWTSKSGLITPCPPNRGEVQIVTYRGSAPGQP
jgi:transposase InsO family protein